MVRWTRTAAGAIALAAMVAGGAAHAQFYKGKTITMIVNYPAGGSTDIEARIVAQYLPDHIPGHPRLIVKNMGGGSGLIGANFLGELAKPDGTTVGFFTWSPISQILNDPGLRVKYSSFEFAGGIENPFIAYIRTDTPPGIGTAKDIMKAKDFKALTLGPSSTNSLNIAIALEILGIRYRHVAGYKGVKPIETGILQDEGQMASTSTPGWRASVEPNMAKRGIVVPLWQLAPPNADGKYLRHSSLPEVPTFEEFYLGVKGVEPSGLAYDALRMAMDAQTSLFRTVFLPPSTPKDVVETLSKALIALWQDKAFHSTYGKVVRSEPRLVPVGEGKKIMAGLANVSPKIIEYLRRTVAMTGKAR